MRFNLFFALGVAMIFAACSQSVSPPSDDEETSTVSSSSKKGKSSSSKENEKHSSSSADKQTNSSSSEKVDSDKSSSSSVDELDDDCVGDTGEPWNGTTAKDFACGAGTKLSPYVILTAEQLAHLSFVVNAGDKDYSGKYFKLGADIKLNKGDVIDEKGALVGDSTKLHKWTPIGNSSVSFDGNFDGAGHTISGMFINTTSTHNGLFGNNQGYISNFVLKDSWVNGGKNTAGIAGNSGGSIIAVQNYASVTGTENIGGIAGQSNGPYPKNASIRTCDNYGIIKGKTFVAGIVGITYQSTLDSCENYGLVEGVSNVGGIAGRGGYTYVSTYLFECENVVNHASIIGTGDNIGGIIGVAGYASSSISGNQTITTLKFAKNMASVSGGNYVGGVIGLANRADVQILANEGNVDGQKYVSGVVGKFIASSSQSLYNVGDVSGTIYIGGIIGDNEEGVTSSAYSTGKVDGDSLVGLMIGYNYNTTMADYYYLKQGDQEPFGLNNGGGVATPKSADEMKSEDFAELLGEAFTYDSGLNGGFPVLVWENE